MRSMKGPAAVVGVIAAAVALTACQATSTTSPKYGGTPPQSAQTAVGYATSILDMAALPVGAEPASHLPVALIDGAGVPAIPAFIDVHRTFLLSHPVSLGSFVEKHSPRGAISAGNQMGVDPNNLYEAGYSLSLPTTNRHAAYVLLDYSMGASGERRRRAAHRRPRRMVAHPHRAHANRNRDSYWLSRVVVHQSVTRSRLGRTDSRANSQAPKRAGFPRQRRTGRALHGGLTTVHDLRHTE